MFDLSVANPLGSMVLARAGKRAGFPIEEAVKAKYTTIHTYGGTYRLPYKFTPLAFSARGGYSSSVRDLAKEPDRLKAAETVEDYLEVSE